MLYAITWKIADITIGNFYSSKYKKKRRRVKNNL